MDDRENPRGESRHGTSSPAEEASALPLGHWQLKSGTVNLLLFSPDGRHLVIRTVQGELLAWKLAQPPTPTPPAWLSDFAEAIAGARLGGDGVLSPVPSEERERILDQIARLDSADRWAAWARSKIGK